MKRRGKELWAAETRKRGNLGNCTNIGKHSWSRQVAHIINLRYNILCFNKAIRFGG